MKTFSQGTELETKVRARTVSATLAAFSLLLSLFVQPVSGAQSSDCEVEMVAFGWIPFKGDKTKPADTAQQHALYLQPTKTSAPAAQSNKGSATAPTTQPSSSSPAQSSAAPTTNTAPQSFQPPNMGAASQAGQAPPDVAQPTSAQTTATQSDTAQSGNEQQVQTKVDTQTNPAPIPAPPNSMAPLSNAAQPASAVSNPQQAPAPQKPRAVKQFPSVSEPEQAQTLQHIPVIQFGAPQQQPSAPAETRAAAHVQAPVETQAIPAPTTQVPLPAPVQVQVSVPTAVQTPQVGNAPVGGAGYVTRQWQQPIGAVADAALVSVLNDISRVLKDPAEVAKIDDVNQRAVLSVARQILAKALQKPGLVSDRIVHNGGKNSTAMSTEAWSSGDIKLSEQTRGSLTTVWAKHENGLLQITLAGECNDRLAPNGAKIGEFIVALSAKSPIDKGLDIQTQSEVRYWLGKISSISVESSCLNATASAVPPTDKVVATTGSDTATQNASGDDKDGSQRKEPVVLQPVVTQRGRQYMIKNPSPDHWPNGGSAPAATTNDAVQPSVSAEAAAVEAQLSAGPPAEIKQPSAGAILILPERVIAGEKMTASLVNASLGPESAVEVTFNGTTRYTDKRGLALYAVPEDADPGRSLNVSLTARPNDAPMPIEVIQPLSHPTQQFAPKMDSIEMTATSGMALIVGHNFEGAATLNHVVFDGQNEARILAASPVQLKILVPASVQQGVHNISIAVGTMRSAPVAFKIITTGAHRTAAR